MYSEAVGVAHIHNNVLDARGVSSSSALCTAMTLRQVCAHPRLLLAPEADNVKENLCSNMRKRLQPLAAPASPAGPLEMDSPKFAVLAAIISSTTTKPKDKVVLVAHCAAVQH
jgi:hypothetical protein